MRTVEKRSFIGYKGRLIDFPFQKNIHQLPQDEFVDCLHDLYFARAPYELQRGADAPPAPEGNFKEMLYARFGRSIAEKFLIPYNEKLYATDLSSLDRDAMGRFFPHALRREAPGIPDRARAAVDEGARILATHYTSYIIDPGLPGLPVVQYAGFVTGNWGTSTYFREEVITLLPPYLWNTAILSGVALAVTCLPTAAIGALLVTVATAYSGARDALTLGASASLWGAGLAAAGACAALLTLYAALHAPQVMRMQGTLSPFDLLYFLPVACLRDIARGLGLFLGLTYRSVAMTVLRSLEYSLGLGG